MLLLYKLRRLEIEIALTLTIATVHLISVKSHVCLLVKRPDPSQGGTFRWSLSKDEICRCQRVEAPIDWPTCPGQYNDGDLWFVDNPRPLTMRSSWKKGILDELLERTAYCDINNCTNGTQNCDVNAECSVIYGNFNCTCRPGYDGDGISCTDIDECTDGSHNCDVNAECSNIDGSFHCACTSGYDGGRINCSDIDECTDGTHTCDDNAECSNIYGNFNCTCEPGYEGDGINCTDIDECTDGTHTCDVNAECCNINGSFKCTCKLGYVGDGINCITGTCNESLGIEDGRMNDSQITASSQFLGYGDASHCYAAKYARLNLVSHPVGCLYPVIWSAQTMDGNQWIQAALGSQKWVTGVLLQGRYGCCDQWVTQFKVAYSDDGENWQYVSETNDQTEMEGFFFGVNL